MSDIEHEIRDIIANINHTISKEEALERLIDLHNDVYDQGYIVGWMDGAKS